MWTYFNDAIKEYAAKRRYILAENYCLPWQPSDLSKANNILSQIFNGDDKIQTFQVNTPSIGQYWPTHPTYRYISENNTMAFIKCSTVSQIRKEFHNLHEMKRHSIPVPSPLGIYECAWDDDNRDLYQQNEDNRGAILVEEFLYSISLGHALVDQRIELNELLRMVIRELLWLHSVGCHGDMKHQHIRICIKSDFAHKMIFESPTEDNKTKIVIGSVGIIDAEDYKDSNKEKDVLIDLKNLFETTNKYLHFLNDADVSKQRLVTIMSKKTRMNRFSELLETINDKYNLKKPFIVR